MVHSIHTLLLHTCKGDAATRVQSAEHNNGLKVWRVLCGSKLPKSATAAFGALREPVFASNDPRLNLQQWDRETPRYEQRFGERISDTIRRSVYQNKIAPHEVQQRLQLRNRNVSSNCDKRRPRDDSRQLYNRCARSVGVPLLEYRDSCTFIPCTYAYMFTRVVLTAHVHVKTSYHYRLRVAQRSIRYTYCITPRNKNRRCLSKSPTNSF